MRKKDKQKLSARGATPKDGQGSVFGGEVSINQSGETDWFDSSGDNEGQLLLDVFADEENIYIKSTIAGVKPEDLEISINNDMLTIRGNREHQREVEENDYFYQECYWGSFSRSIILPAEVKSDQVSADLKSGVLTIVLPKANRSRNISIKVKD